LAFADECISSTTWDVDRGLGDSGWKNFPGTVLVHGDEDAVVPIELSKELVGVIGKCLVFFLN
jgi:hypothetical protein